MLPKDVEKTKNEKPEEKMSHTWRALSEEEELLKNEPKMLKSTHLKFAKRKVSWEISKRKVQQDEIQSKREEPKKPTDKFRDKTSEREVPEKPESKLNKRVEKNKVTADRIPNDELKEQFRLKPIKLEFAKVEVMKIEMQHKLRVEEMSKIKVPEKSKVKLDKRVKNRKTGTKEVPKNEKREK